LRVTDRIALWKEHNKLEKPESLAIFYDFYTKIKKEKDEILENDKNTLSKRIEKINSKVKKIREESKFEKKKTFEVNKKVKEAYICSTLLQTGLNVDKEGLINLPTAANILIGMRSCEQLNCFFFIFKNIFIF
jgi:hypothetical protein